MENAREKNAPAAVDDEVDDDVLAEVVAVLERDVDRALHVCETCRIAPSAPSASPPCLHRHGKKRIRTFGVVSVDMEDRRVDHLRDVGAVQGRPGTRSWGRVSNATSRGKRRLAGFSELPTYLLLLRKSETILSQQKQSARTRTYLTTKWTLPPTV